LLCFIVLAALGGGGGYLWLQEQEAQHRQTLEETIARALTEASTAFGLAKGEKSGDLTHWEEALEALRRVKSMIEGPGTSEATRTRVATLAAEIESGKQEAIARFAEEERLQEFLATLEEIRFGAGHRSSEPYGAWANDQYSKVFAGYGLDLNSMSVDQACREIAEHPAAFELSQALDEWSVVARQAVRANWGELIEIAQAADPDEDRNVVRDAVLAEDDQALLQLGRDSDLQHLPAATLFLLGTSLLNAGLSEDALALMRYAHRRFPSNVALVHSLAQIISRGRRSGEEALRYAYGVVGLRPSAKSWTLVLTLLDQQDHAVAAHELALEMLEQYPTDPDTLLAVGRVLAFQGVPDPSLLALKKLRHLGEQSSMSLFLEGVCHTMNNDLEAARAKYQASLQEPEIEEAHLRSHIGLGRLALNEGDWQGARREFEASSSIQGTYAQGLLSYQEGDLQGAEIDLIGSLRTANDRVDPTRANFPPILQDMVRWLTTCPIERLRDSAKALTTAERLLEIKKNADAWSQLGAARFRCQDYQGADRAFQRAAVVRGVHHADPAPLFFRAMTQWHLGERENARESYRKALLALQSKTPVFQSLERLVALPLKEEAAALLEIEE
jgi:tetratricopeptide (TPR) repeat protein